MTQPICDVLLPDGTRCGYVALGLTAHDRIADLHRHQHDWHVRSEVVTAEVSEVEAYFNNLHDETRQRLAEAIDSAFDEHGNLKPEFDKGYPV